ncbi:DUF3017 domain-containing protein [Flaviflexus salsibiostraticola]|uniref:DUF3017 domain-containing protein n=1 Tax=Flaviflexus salsibiostraticola TaxID=1282737 RepID=A0A3S8Z8L7_9ACTO|nr:DUF3017 domain-containing protein [Flaviflexus salsibiostraticola]AZN29676.1 DUF3017 domain-containing protein [Flaviflexus salsibiostraticola]
MGENRVPAPALLTALFFWVVAIVVLGFIAGPVSSIRALGATMVGLAAARLVLPTGAVPDVRGRAWDAATLTILGLALLGLAEWGNATNVA